MAWRVHGKEVQEVVETRPFLLGLVFEGRAKPKYFQGFKGLSIVNERFLIKSLFALSHKLVCSFNNVAYLDFFDSLARA